MQASDFFSILSTGTGLLAKVVPPTAVIAVPVSVISGVAATITRANGS